MIIKTIVDYTVTNNSDVGTRISYRFNEKERKEGEKTSTLVSTNNRGNTIIEDEELLKCAKLIEKFLNDNLNRNLT